jgi:hypothetical protein
MLSAAGDACIGIALLVFVLGFARAAAGAGFQMLAFVDAIRLALEFLLAGGLLRLASLSTYPALATAAAIVLVRQLIVVGLARQASGPRAP